MQQRLVLTKTSPNPFLPTTEYRYSMTWKRRQEVGPTRSPAGFHAESSSRRDSVPAGRHEQSRDSRINAADVSANYGDLPISKNLLSRHETHAAAPNGQRQPSSTNLPSYTREDVQRRVLQKFKDEGRVAITRCEFEEAVDDAMRRLQQEQAYMQPPYENSTVRRQMLTNETEADRGSDSSDQFQSGISMPPPALGDHSFEKSYSGSPADFQAKGASQPSACFLSSSPGGNSVLMDPTASVKKEWHRSAVHEYEDSIMTESQVSAPDHPKRLFPDDVTKLFAEITNLVSRLPDLDGWLDIEKVRSISERVHCRISIFNELSRGIDKLEDQKPAELSIREEMRRKILELEDPGLRISNTKAHPGSTASTGQEDNATNGSQASCWEGILSTLLTKVDRGFMNANVELPIIAFCYYSLLGCCWSALEIEFYSVTPETTAIGHGPGSHNQQDLKILWYIVLTLLLGFC
jgi:hypothetical protein